MKKPTNTPVKSLFGSEEAHPDRGCYAELLALRYFRRAVMDYTCKQIDTDLFGPFVRNIVDESLVFEFRDRMMSGRSGPKDADKRPGFDWASNGRTREALAGLWNDPKLRSACRRQLLAWTDALIAEYEVLSANDPLRGRLAELKSTLRLSNSEMDILQVLWLRDTDKLECCQVPFAVTQVSGFLALVTGLGEQDVLQTLLPSSRLCRFGCVGSTERHFVHPKICFFLDGLSDEPLASSFYSRDDGEVLPADFFGKLAEDHLPTLRQLLEGPRGKKVNVLLYGAPGTGKSSFARVLAKVTGRTAYQVCQRPKDKDGEFRAASPEIRYAAVEICDEQTDSDTSLMIVDEADVLLRGNRHSMFGDWADVPTGDKGLLNDVLERIETPTVWIANTPAREIDASSRRRFDYAIRFDPLTEEQRLATWRNASQAAGADKLIPAADLEACCAEFPVSTGIAARALGNVARAGAEGPAASALFRRLLGQQVELSGTMAKDDRALKPCANYSTEGLNIRSAIPLDRIERAVKRFLDAGTRKNDPDAPRMNLLLTGAPGCGKTEFVKHLAVTLGRPLMMRRASDLKSKWVGETEQNIAAAFAEAKAKDEILFLDEVDTFLDNRSSLVRSWEKSMVNEVLQQMEAFGGVFIGTTNFKDALDPAVARRFTYKIEIDPPDAKGRRVFWRRFFGTEPRAETAARLDALEGLTPGDFRTVRQSLYYLGDEATDAERLDGLAAELAARVRAARPIGFSGL